ncbi:hypothetical protein [Hyphomonas sp.]|uniref:hypothetical protein n=1 Tax=Hyphomonas sp. TaxID=87 RepID=UPI00391D5348
MIRKLRYALAAGVAALTVPAAMAEACGAEDITRATRDLQSMLTLATPVGQAQAAASRIDAQARTCPETAWIRLIAAGAEINLLERHEAADPEVSASMLAQRFGHVERAYEHLEFFRRNKPEDFRHGAIRLAYNQWAEVAGNVIAAMLRFADKGRVHPLVSETPPPLDCDFVVKHMATTASGWRYTSSFPALNYLNAAADACRPSDDPLDWGVLTQRADQLVVLVKDGHISEPSRIRWALREAYRDSRQYLDGREAPYSFWSTSDETALMEQIGKHKVSLEFYGDRMELPKAAWFAAGNADSLDTVYSVGLAISGFWTPLAAGVTDAEVSEVTAARAAFVTAVRDIGAEADAAGQTMAGRTSILKALEAFQEGDIRTPEAAALPGMPDWMHRLLKQIFQQRIDEAG